jgi:hypothetical protein
MLTVSRTPAGLWKVQNGCSEVALVAYGNLGLRVLRGRLYDWERTQVIRLVESQNGRTKCLVT